MTNKKTTTTTNKIIITQGITGKQYEIIPLMCGILVFNITDNKHLGMLITTDLTMSIEYLKTNSLIPIPKGV